MTKNPKAWRTVRPVKCNRCGDTSVGWVQSKRGKWYLIDLLVDPDLKDEGLMVGSVFSYHSKFCGKGGAA